jgi:hypothetical protein
LAALKNCSEKGQALHYRPGAKQSPQFDHKTGRNEMGFLDVFLARPRELDEAEARLGRPDPREASDLPFHIERCALRWDLSYRASRHNGAQIERLCIIIVLGVSLLIASDIGTVHKFLASI